MGRPQFETIVANASRERMVKFETTIPAPTAIGQFQAVNFLSAPGTISKIVAMYIFAIKAGTVGTHKVTVGYFSPSIDIMAAESTFASDILLNDSYFVTANSGVWPTTPEAQLMTMLGIQFDSITPLSVGYLNNTNAVQNNPVTIRLWAIEKTVG